MQKYVFGGNGCKVSVTSSPARVFDFQQKRRSKRDQTSAVRFKSSGQKSFVCFQEDEHSVLVCDLMGVIEKTCSSKHRCLTSGFKATAPTAAANISKDSCRSAA